ncbi:MAG: hypothetical protein WCI74_21370, partial [Actinomycetes bacterium]
PPALAPQIGDGKKTVTINDGLVKYYEQFASLGGQGFRYADKHGNGIALTDLQTGKEPKVGGDALGDHELLNIAENRLWITRLDKPANQKQIAEQTKVDQPGTWLLQPTISRAPVGFASSLCQIQARPGMKPNVQSEIKASLASIEPTGKLAGFSNCGSGSPCWL